MRILRLVLIAIGIWAISAHAQNVEYVGSTLWTGVNDVKVVGHYAYCAFFNGLMILDISNPVSPTFVSQYYIGGDCSDFNVWAGQKLVVSGDYVYFAADFLGLKIINVSDPANPYSAGQFITPTYARGVDIQGNYAYIVEYSLLQIVDINNPSTPVLVGDSQLRGCARDIYVQGAYAFIANDNRGMQILDVSNPAIPVIVSDYSPAFDAVDMAIQGNYVYIASDGGGLYVIDITDRTNPALIGRLGLSHVHGIFVNGSYAYLAIGNFDATGGSFLIADITNPAAPVQVASIGGACYLDLFVSGDYAYLGAYQSGIEVIDVADPFNPRRAYGFNPSTSIYNIFISGNYAYVASGDTGLSIVNITNPSYPEITGSCTFWYPYNAEYDRVWDVFISGNYAYLACGYQVLRIVNISNPRSPIEVGSLWGFSAVNIYVRGSYAYMPARDHGLYTVNVSDPTHPVLASQYNSPDCARSVDIAGNYIYLADRSSLEILDLTDPSNPSFVASFDQDIPTVFAVSIHENYAFIAGAAHNNHYGLLVVDVEDPSNPFLTGFCETPGYAWDVSVSGDYAYVAEMRHSWDRHYIQAINISDLANPVLADSFMTAGAYADWDGPGFGLCVSGENLFVVDRYSLMILHSNLTGLNNNDLIPAKFSLSQNYPNPFNASTSISYSLPKLGPVNLSIYNLLGQKVAHLFDGRQNAGEHSIIWDAGDFPSGVYFARLESGGETMNIKMVMMK